MSSTIDIKINVDEILGALEDNLDVTLEAVGSYIQGGATLKAPVDTGLLRNSITYAVAGEPPKMRTYKADKPDDTGKINTGTYVGSTTKAPGEHAVLIGTNVKYGIYQELGTSKGRSTPFLRPTMEQELKNGKLKELIEMGLKGYLG